jgi:hypothetical protein
MTFNQGLKRYLRRYIDHPIDTATGVVSELEYDVVTELWFDDVKTRDRVLRYAGSGVLPPAVIADEEKLFDRRKTRMVAITECETPL